MQTESEWLEAARQAFLWRWHFDDCNRVREDVRRDGWRSDRVVVPGGDLGMNGTTDANKAA